MPVRADYRVNLLKNWVVLYRMWFRITIRNYINTMSKILIVEDEISISTMYKFRLEQAGYEVTVAKNGVEGVEMAEKVLPDLILLDIKMPEMSGDAALTRIRETKWGANIRVIVLTNISRDEAPSAFRILNVSRYIVKASYTPTQVLDVLNEVLSGKSKHTK